MRRGLQRHFFALFILISSLFLPPQTMLLTEGEVADYPIIIDIPILEGAIIGEAESFEVYLENEEAPILVTWELHENGQTKIFFDVTEDIEVLNTHQNRTSWKFDVLIEPQIIGSCSCILTIMAFENQSNPVEASQSVFVSPTSEQLNPTVYVQDLVDDNWASGDQTFNGISSSYSSEVPEISYQISQSGQIKCSTELNGVDSDLATRSYPITVWDGEVFEITVDVSGFSDGWHDIIVHSRDPLTALYGNYCFSVRVDNTPPKSIILGPEQTTESMGTVVFDGSATSDEYWGISGIVYVWSVYEEAPSYNRQILVKSGQDARSISIDSMTSGMYFISLTSIDNAGNSHTANSVLNISNLAPIARLQIDGTQVFDGDEVPITKDSTFLIDASTSTDTANDQASLRYVWRIDNIPVYEGTARELDWPEDVGDEFILTLEVIDDDSVSSIVSVSITDNEPTVPPALPILALLGSVLFLLYAISIRAKDRPSETDIPKWV